MLSATEFTVESSYFECSQRLTEIVFIVHLQTQFAQNLELNNLTGELTEDVEDAV